MRFRPRAQTRPYLDLFPHLFVAPPETSDTKRTVFFDALMWCSEEFGGCGHGDRFTYGLSWVVFRDEADAVLFKLRWC